MKLKISPEDLVQTAVRLFGLLISVSNMIWPAGQVGYFYTVSVQKSTAADTRAGLSILPKALWP